jgi:dihydropteroate synthase
MATTPHNARVLSLATDAEIIREMRLVDAEEAGIQHMLPKARHYLVKLEKVRRPIAHILKETFLSNGGEAVVSHGLITAAVSDSDVILSGTRRQFERAFSSLVEQGFGCDQLAADIEAAIRHFDSPPLVPEVTQDPAIAQMFDSIGKRTLIVISLVQSRHPHQNRCGLRNGNARYGGHDVHSTICIRRTSPAGRSNNKGTPVW